MPRDLIDAGTYESRRATVQNEIAQARQAYDFAALTAEGQNTEEVQAAKARLDAAKDQLEVLDRAWAGRQREIEREETEQRQAERKSRIEAVRQSDAACRKSAAKVGRCEEAYIAALIEHGRDRAKHNENVGSAGHGARNERRTLDALSHRQEGALLLGHLQAAGVPGLDEMDPIDASRAYANITFKDLVTDRLDRVLRSISQDVPELKE